MLAIGFFGTLRNWWDKHLTEDSREEIRKAIKKNEDGLPIFDKKLVEANLVVLILWFILLLNILLVLLLILLLEFLIIWIIFGILLCLIIDGTKMFFFLVLWLDLIVKNLIGKKNLLIDYLHYLLTKSKTNWSTQILV